MKKFTKFIVIVLVFLLVASLVACGPTKPNQDESDIFDVKQDAINMQVSATSDKINIALSTNANAGEGTVEIFAVNANEYLKNDQYSGMSNDKIDFTDKSKKIGEYILGENKTISIDRYNQSFDRLYCKYYAVDSTKIIKGPIYATDITAINEVEPEFDIKSKKGILGENVDYYKSLNCSYVTLNFEIENLIYPNEMYEDGEKIELSHPDNAYSFVSNGTTYYFNKGRVDHFDNEVKKYYNEKAYITAIVYAKNNGANPEQFPQNMTFLPWATQGTGILSINTSNQEGLRYYVAIMEFLASRYSSSNFENGYVANYIIGNEIDYASDYFRIAEKRQSLDTYMEEYSRVLRLSNLAVKKYNDKVAVNAPFTQAWAEIGYNQDFNYAPKNMIKWLNQKSKIEGDYDWGIAPHCYTIGLAQPVVFLNDTTNGRDAGMTGDSETTSKITFSNLEVLGEFLANDTMKYNGKLRSVWLTEQGVSSLESGDYVSQKEENRLKQAGNIAAIWYKISQLDFVTGFCYYRLRDALSEGIACFGLIDAYGEPKPSYNVFKYIDTQYSDIVSKEFLQYVSYVDSNNNEHSVANGNITSYLDFLDVFETGWFNFEFDWSKATPVIADKVYEYEDLVDLSSVIFENKNFLYDGTQKRLEALGLPQGVTVQYDSEPVLTERGHKQILATFYKDNDIVGRRTATISVGDVTTNKSVYAYGEKIFVTANTKGLTITQDAWIGLYKKGANPGNTTSGDVSYYYFYPNQYGDNFLRTKCLQDYKNPGANFSYLPVGEYVLYYFDSSDYSYFYSIDITIVPDYQQKNSINLSNIDFSEKTFTYDGELKRLEIVGNLPQGVTVEYSDNTRAEIGSVCCTAIFKYNEVEIERRYAVMTISRNGDTPIALDKEEYFVGEEVLVTAIAPESSDAKSWWVGVYLANENDYSSVVSIYWYYVKDDNHISGKEYSITKDASFNSSRLEYKDLPVGEYKVVLFNTSGYTVEMEIAFEVKQFDFGNVEGTINVDNNFNVGEDININATFTENLDFNYKLIIVRDIDMLLLGNAIYTIDAINNVNVNILQGVINADKNFLAPLRAGQYKIALFVVNGNFYKILDEKSIQYGTDEEQPKAGTLYTDKTEYSVGENIYVTAFAPDDSGSRNWWVGLYLEEIDDYATCGGSIYWYYVKSESHISGDACLIQSADLGGYQSDDYKNLPAGNYKLVLFNTSGYTVETTVSIVIK